MMIVGLTGGIGSGKSAASAIFKQLGVPIIDTDIIAREVVAVGEPAYQAVVKHFGQGILLPNKELNRSALKQRIIDDTNERLALENILHPIILETVKRQLQQLDCDYCIIVIPLLVEKDRYSMLERILVIDAPETEQILRVSERDKLDKSSIERLMAIQAPRTKRLAIADDVITNDKDFESFHTAVRKMHDKYMNLCHK